MTENIVGRIDPNIPQFWVHCDAWNDWPERVLISNTLQGETVGESWYIPERTCHMTYNDEWSGDEYYPTQVYRCSECGGMTETGKPRYCPDCGAKVVD